MYLSVDPGEHAGFCVLDDDLSILGCGINAPPREKYKVVLVERPTIYPHSGINPANIITLAITLGKIVGPLEELGARIKEVEPRTWKGQIKKPPHHRAIRKALPAAELAIVNEDLRGIRAKLQEDAMDAVGLAIYGRRMKLFC